MNYTYTDFYKFTQSVKNNFLGLETTHSLRYPRIADSNPAKVRWVFQDESSRTKLPREGLTLDTGSSNNLRAAIEMSAFHELVLS